MFSNLTVIDARGQSEKMPTAKRIKKQLLANIREVCQFLLPNGYFDGANWRVGSVRGEDGKSLSVCLTGELMGVWNDFAEDGDHRGDIIKLWMMVRAVPFPTALAQAEKWLRHRPKADRSDEDPASLGIKMASPITPPKIWDVRILESWRAGAQYVRDNPDLKAALDEWRGWPSGTADALSQRDAIAYLSPCRDPHCAFKVELPHTCWLTPVGYHARPVEDPPGGKASWYYCPNRKQNGISIPALPFVLGGDQFKEADLVVIMEGQWDAITWAAAAGWLSPTCPMPPGVTIFGIRGSGTWGHLLKYWHARWPAHAAFLLIPDGDDAGRAWHGEFAHALAQRADKVVILDPPQGRDFSDLNDETPFDPTAIQRLLGKYNLPIIK